MFPWFWPLKSPWFSSENRALPDPKHVREMAAWGTPRDRIASHVSPKWCQVRRRSVKGHGRTVAGGWENRNLYIYISGWWWLEPWNFEWLSHHIGNVMIPIDELHHFSEHHFSEGLKPPTSMYIHIYIYMFIEICNGTWNTNRYMYRHRCYIYIYVGFHKWRYPNSWMVNNGKYHFNGWELGVPLFQETLIYLHL